MNKYNLLLLICLLSKVVQAGDFPIGQLTLGEHRVGFEVFHEFDERRSFRPQYDEQGNIQRTYSPRPMQIAVWYPTDEKRASIEFRDYWYLNLTREKFFTPDEDDKQKREMRYVNMWGMLGELDKEQMRENLTLQMNAVMQAKPKLGSFPLVILAQRENRGVFINFQLAEFLASHGYVVAITPAKAKTDNSPQFNFWNQDGIQAGLADLQFVKGYMMSFPSVDKNKISVVGYGFGSTTALALAQDDAHIGAVVSLAGIVGTDNDFIKPTFEAMNYFNDPLRIQTPLLHIGVNDMQGNKERSFHYFDTADFADVHYVKMANVDEIAMGSSFIINWLMSLADGNKYQYSNSDAAVAYDRALQSTLVFLDYYMKGKRDVDPFSKLTSINSGEASSYKFKAGKTPIPTEAFFMKTFRNDPEKAEELFNRFYDESPTKPIVSSTAIGNLGVSLNEKALYERSLIAHRIATKAYADKAWSHSGLAFAYLGLKQTEKAKTAYKKALTLEIPDWLQPEIDDLKNKLEAVN